MYLDIVTDMNEALNIVTSDNSDAVIRACIYLLSPLYLRILLFTWLVMKMLLTIFLKIPHIVIEVVVVPMMLLLALKLVQSCVHHTCGGGHDIVYIPTTFWWWGWNLLPIFFKGGGLTRSQFLEGVSWERGSDLFQEGLQFLHKR